jgi:peptidyl-prolyl cis-trans isomerase D
MSLLDKMRSGSDSTFMQLMLGAVFLAFVASSGMPQGDARGQVIATVNGVAISDIAYRRAMLSQQRGTTMTEEEKQALGERVKAQLIKDEVVLQEAQRLGLQVSRSEIEHAIAYDPLFADSMGVFDPERYEKRLKNMGYERADYEDMVRDRMLRAKLVGVTGDGLDVSDAEVKAAWLRNATQIDLTWVRIPALRFDDDVDTTPEAVAKFVEANADRVKDAYDKDFDRLYNVPLKVRVTVIRLPIREDGVSAADLEKRIDDLQRQIEGGADMSAHAKRNSEDVTAREGGARPPAPLADFDPSASTALEALEPGKLVKVVSARDVWLYRLEERLGAHVIPMEEVKDVLAKQIMREEGAPGLAAAFAEQVLAEWKQTGAVPESLLATQEITAESSGLFSPSQGLQKQGPPAELLEELADAPVGPPLRVSESQKTYWLAAVTSRVEPDAAEFEGAKDELREEVRATRRVLFARAWTDDLVARAKVK